MEILDDQRCAIPKQDEKRLIKLASSLDQLGYFPKEATEIITKNNHFHLFVPQEVGGLDCTLSQGMRIIEAYSRIEGNLGWIVQIGAGGGVFAAYLEEKVAMKYLGRPEQVIAGSDFVGGEAVPVQGGYEVSGFWKYASGSMHATAFTGNCRIIEGPDRGKVKAVIVPANEVQVIQEWNAMGMRATDSHSFRIENIFVPENHTFVVAPDHLLIKNRLLKLPFLLYARALFTPVLIGVAYHYLNLYREYIHTRNYQPDTLPVLTSNNLERVLCTSRNDLYQVIEDIWELAGTKMVQKDLEQKFENMCVRITDDLLRVVDQCHRHTGMEGVRMSTPLNVAYRNMKTAAAHYLLSPGSLSFLDEKH